MAAALHCIALHAGLSCSSGKHSSCLHIEKLLQLARVVLNGTFSVFICSYEVASGLYHAPICPILQMLCCMLLVVSAITMTGKPLQVKYRLALDCCWFADVAFLLCCHWQSAACNAAVWLTTKGRRDHDNASALKPAPSHSLRRHILTESGLAGSVWRHRPQQQPLQYPSHSHGQPLGHHDQLPSPQSMPQQQSTPQAKLVNAAAAAGQQQHRLPPPGFEDSTAGSQWLHAVQMAGLAEGQHYQQPADNGQDNQQAWANAQPVAMVLLLLTTSTCTHVPYWTEVGLSITSVT